MMLFVFCMRLHTKIEMQIFSHREALISRPDELSYEVINIQATKVMLNVCTLVK